MYRVYVCVDMRKKIVIFYKIFEVINICVLGSHRIFSRIEVYFYIYEESIVFIKFLAF